MVFVEVILPVILIFLSGYIVQKIFKVDIKPISTMSIYILMPALVFETFYKTPLNSQLLYIVITSLLIFLALVVVVIFINRLCKQDIEQESALILSSAFANSGNYGVPIVLFAFGKDGMNYAIPIMVFHSILMSIFGVYFAARGQAGIRVAIKTVLKQPTNYAIIPAILLQQFQVKIPANFYESIQLVGNCAVPIVMVILGMQLADVNSRNIDWKNISVASIIKLVASPILAYVICLLFPIDPLLQKVIIILAAMPTAATTAMYAIQFNTKPQFVSSGTLVTTVLSFATLTVLLSILT
ncbi:AEC family transporter [Bacillus sp. EB600]|uniref:AEC family transporter n=1 Tax=Bacillus sp. EB600 TaxID=2806345 RepID=UPI00210EF9B7|nr:AEC family transporter [Bacillus sp. EB600]MCQ6279055.1 AEC family transporter [Bacillus sp. EB600]